MMRRGAVLSLVVSVCAATARPEAVAIDWFSIPSLIAAGR